MSSSHCRHRHHHLSFLLLCSSLVLVLAWSGVLTLASGTTGTTVDPNNTPQHHLATASKAFASSDIKRALHHYDQAVALEPQNYLTLFRRAVVYSSAMLLAQAIADFTQVLVLNPGYDKVRGAWACCGPNSAYSIPFPSTFSIPCSHG
jgi:Tfp pilus assembly protein PilF